MAIYSKEEINASLIKVKKFLLDSLHSKKIVFFDGKKILEKSKIQALLKTRLDDELSRVLLEVILENAFKAENLSAGGFQSTILAFLQDSSFQELESYHPTKDDISIILKEKLNDLESNLLFCALDMAGFAGKISIEKSQNDKFSVEFIDSCSFSINYLSNSQPGKLLKPKILIIDGFVESVSEINLLLQSLTNTGHQLVLIARGFDPEVINTINVNNQRKSLSVFLVQVPFDVEGLNALVDICSVCDCNVISSNLGQLIANVDIDDATNVDEVIISKNKLSIKNRNSQKRVSLHLKDLYDRLKERQELSEIYEKRISSLNSNNVIIRIPDNSRFVEISQNIDTCLRSIKSAMELGVSADREITASKISSIIFSKKAKKMIEDLQFIML